jgi:maltooligosyltrehalose trehalohydrolase
MITSKTARYAKRLHDMPFGTTLVDGKFQSRLWAPSAQRVDFCLYSQNGSEKILPTTAAPGGWFTLDSCPEAKVGDLYHFIIDGGLRVPDPASRRQPQGVHGPSEITDPTSFKWKDSDWRGKPFSSVAIYELHVGTFTPEGTFKAAQRKLKYLKAQGWTAIELMPLWECPGKASWGYDGTLPFAIQARYGTPDDLKNFIQEAHRLGLLVYCDSVWNHFGPEGNYLYAYAKQFFNPLHKTPWGDAINFDSDGREVVRPFYVNLALFLLEEYNFDGIRADAVHAIVDTSEKHILTEIIEAVAWGPGKTRQRHLMFEEERNTVRWFRKGKSNKGKGIDAVWNDDFHHAVHVHLTGETHGYYREYAKATCGTSSTEFLGRCLAQLFGHQGHTLKNGHIRGESSKHIPLKRGVNFLQNHDQIGNRAMGERLASLTHTRALRASAAIYLLSPGVVMTFMGEEWGCKTPFFFFCDLGPQLNPLVTEGRRNEFREFPSFTDPAQRELIPDPCSLTTFERSKLNWSDLHQPEHRRMRLHYRQLLKLRQAEIVPLIDNVVVPAKGKKTGPSYTVLADGKLEVCWPLTDGRKLMVFINLTDDPTVSEKLARALNSGNQARVIYATDKRGLVAGKMKPWSVTWLLID